MKCHIHLHSSLDGRVDAAVDGKERQVLDPFESVAYFLVAEALAGVDQDDAQALLARSSSPAAAVDIALKFIDDAGLTALLTSLNVNESSPICYLPTSDVLGTW